MEAKHTPDSWKIRYTSKGQYEVEPEPKTAEERAAYAKLMRAAPELLAALDEVKLAIQCFVSHNGCSNGDKEYWKSRLVSVNEVLSKAKGE